MVYIHSDLVQVILAFYLMLRRIVRISTSWSPTTSPRRAPLTTKRNLVELIVEVEFGMSHFGLPAVSWPTKGYAR